MALQNDSVTINGKNMLNMKRLFNLIVLLMLVSVSAMADDSYTDVDNIQKFIETISANPSAHIRLTADINLSDTHTGSLSGVTFKGVIDGKGTDKDGYDIVYSIIGLGKNTPKDPIFKDMSGAKLQNLCIRSFRLVDESNDNLGVLGNTATGCHFTNVVFSDISVFCDEDYAGAIVGQAFNCNFRGVKIMGCDISVDGRYAGGFVGSSQNCFFYDCINSMSSGVFADGSWGDAYAGGFVGKSDKDTFQYCANLSLVCGDDDRVGGITGYSDHSNFWQCSNSGMVVQGDEEDYLASRAELMKKIQEYQQGSENHLKIMFATLFGSIAAWTTLGLAEFGLLLGGVALGVSLVTVGGIIFAIGMAATIIEGIIFFADAHDELGGICGYALGGSFKECANYSQCATRDMYVGGIVGQTNGKYDDRCVIETCLNQGSISGYEHVGGIVGCCEYTKVSNCLNTGPLSSYCKIENDIYGIDAGVNTFSNNYFKAKKYNVNSNEFKAVTEEQLNSGQVAWWLNGGNGTSDAPWRQTLSGDNKDRYPTLDNSHDIVTEESLSGRYTVSTADELMAFAADVNKGAHPSYIVYIGSDIDMKDRAWTPIGTEDNQFVGLCFGGGHTISNLKCNTSSSRAGIFGSIGIKTEIHDINLGKGSSIKGINAVGGIVGCVENQSGIEGTAIISGCMNYGTITAEYNAGGILGAQYFDSEMRLTINNCCNHGTVTGTQQGESGTISGYVKDGTIVTGCWNDGTVTGFDKGKSFVRYTTSIFVRNCYQYEGLVTDLSDMAQKDVDTYSTEELLNGTLCYKLNGESNDPSVGLPWTYELGSEEGPVTAGYRHEGNGVYHSRTISNRYGTVVLPFNVTSNDYIRYYRLDNDACTPASLSFNAVDTLLAGTPALFCVRANDDSTYTNVYEFVGTDEVFSLENNDDEGNTWNMKGNLSTEPLVMDSGLDRIFYISGNKIKSATNTVTVGSYRAYIEGPADSPAKSFSIVFSDDLADNIRLIPVDAESEEQKTDSPRTGIYNLAGQELLAPSSGINIINGTKVLNGQ